MDYRSALTETEKKEWDQARSLFEKMLDDFNSKNLLRKGIIQIDRQRLALVWENSRNFGLAFNAMVDKFKTKEKAEDFAQKCANADLTKHTLTYLFISQLIGTMLINIESVFKTSLLFFLVEENGIKKDMTLGQLLTTIRKIMPTNGKRFEDLVNTKLRNALAHGTFWFKEGGRVFLATNSYLEEVEEITLAELMIEGKRMNIIAMAFIDTLMQRVREGYFRI